MGVMDELMAGVSMMGFARLWTELHDAYFGRSDYGGDTCELYAYRFLPYSPTSVLNGRMEERCGHDARRALIALLDTFGEAYWCDFKVDGHDPEDWRVHGEPFDHRVHVTVIPRRGEKR